MNSEKDKVPSSIASDEYTREYYQSCCQGYEEFEVSRGRILPPRLSRSLELVQVRPGMLVIDVGCGRGEIVLHCAQQGARVWGIDYAREAVQIARDNLNRLTSPNVQRSLGIQQGDVRYLPFPSDSIDVALMLDVVEHLNPEELSSAFHEVRRVLRPGGQLVVHTMPNLWYYYYGYPLYRRVQLVRGRNLPANPRDRWRFSHVHVNEQTPTRLGRFLRDHGFKTRVWLASTQNYAYETNLFVRWGMLFLTRIYPFRWFFCNDIFAIGTKP